MSELDILEQCLVTGENSTEDLLRCVFATRASESNEVNKNAYLYGSDNLASRNIWLVYSAALVIFMQMGFAMLVAGAVRKSNSKIC